MQSQIEFFQRAKPNDLKIIVSFVKYKFTIALYLYNYRTCPVMIRMEVLSLFYNRIIKFLPSKSFEANA